MSTPQIYKSAGILIKDKKLLVEKSYKKEFYISPGGSIEEGETPQEALIRELMEEFKLKVFEEDLEHFGTFTAKAVDTLVDKVIKMEVFMVNKWHGEPEPDNEVESILWIDSNIPKDIKLGTIFAHDVIPKLKELGLIC